VSTIKTKVFVLFDSCEIRGDIGKISDRILPDRHRTIAIPTKCMIYCWHLRD